MDLLATLSSDPSNPHVSVWRLIEDKQSNSALLFSEKLPFPGSAVAWVPDKRSLTVADVNGNVFVYDAECQRSIELQKVQDCAISSIEWLNIGRFEETLTSRFFKLQSLSLPFSSISSLVGDQTAPVPVSEDIPQTVEYESFGDDFTVMGVLGVKGKVSLYHGGSVPIAEFESPSLSETRFSNLCMSPDLSSICITGESEDISCVVLMSSAILKLRSRLLHRLASRLSRGHWILKNLNTALEIISRAIQLEEIQTFFAHIDDLISSDSPPSCMTSFSLPKLLKLARSTLNTLDYLSVSLISCISHWVDHLSMCVIDIVDMSRVDSGIIGLSPSLVSPMMFQIKLIQSLLSETIESFQLQSRVYKWVFFRAQQWLSESSSEPVSDATSDPLIANLRIPHVERPNEKIDLTKLSLEKTWKTFSSSFLKYLKQVEELFLAIQSNQRRVVGSQITARGEWKFQGDNLKCIWRDSSQIDVVYTNCGDLVFSSFTGEFSLIGSRRFKAPESLAFGFPHFYRNEKICALLQHAQGVSIALIASCADWGDTVVVLPDMYGVPGSFVAQQLPETVSDFSSMAVSASRGLCSIHSKEAGRIVTLDLEPDPDEDDDDESMREEEETEEVKRSKSWFDENKFFNSDGLANVRKRNKQGNDDLNQFDEF